MSVPVLTNGPWTFSVNNICTESSYALMGKHIPFQIKNSLVSFSAWSVVASSNAVSVKNIGDADPDLWADWETDIVIFYDSSPHSWVILENSTTGEQLCFDLNVNTSTRIDAWYSATGSFAADGTINNRPTDTESVRMLPNSINYLPTAAESAVVHAMISADNKCTRFFVNFRDGALVGTWLGLMEELYGTPAIWTSTHKRLIFKPPGNISSNTSPNGQSPKVSDIDAATMWAYLKDATPYEGWNVAYATCECYKGFSSNLGDAFFNLDRFQDWNGGFPCSPLGIFRESATRGGALGAIKDMYAGPLNHYTNSTYDGDTEREWIKLGGLMFPWNGSVPTYLEAGY